MNCPMHTMGLQNGSTTRVETFANWVKIVSWRVNGDGIGNVHQISDSFIRTQDDGTYVRGDRRRCVFWTDVNGAVFVLASIPSRAIVIEDCDVIYARHCSLTWNGGRVFSSRAMGGNTTARVNVLFKDIRIPDKFQTLETFMLLSEMGSTKVGGYSGLVFRNITSEKPPLATENRIIGHTGGPWDDITFDNVDLGGKKILKTGDFAAMTTFVTNVKFLPTALGIDDVNQKSFSSVKMYPNPVSNILTVNFYNIEGSKELQIYTILGQLVYTAKTQDDMVKIDVKSLNLKGVALVKVIANNAILNQKIAIE